MKRLPTARGMLTTILPGLCVMLLLPVSADCTTTRVGNAPGVDDQVQLKQGTTGAPVNDVVHRRKKKRRRRATPKRKSRYDGYTFVSSYYDDNVFNYSDSDRAVFDGSTAPLEKIPIADLSDYVTNVAARGDYLWGIGRRSYWRLRIEAEGRFYARNHDRNYGRFGIGGRRRVRHGSVDLTVRFTPNFYLRHLYWRPMPQRPVGVRYGQAQFDKLSSTANVRWDLSRRVEGRMSFDWSFRNYGFPFDERDNNTYTVSSGAEVKAARKLDVSTAVFVALSRAKGPSGVQGATADISNNRFGVRGGVTWRISRAVRLEESITLSHQSYTGNNPADLAHSDRKDDDVLWSNRLSWRADRHWQPQLFFDYRSSSTSIPPGGTLDVGQYTGNRAGLRMLYFF